MNIDLKALKERADIVAVIRSCGVPLEAKGVNFVALCPFHREKTASFTVNPKKRIYTCFGCKEHGDVFKFVKLFCNLTLPDAIRRVQTLTDGAPPPGPGPDPVATAPLDEDAVDRAPQAVLDRVMALWQRELARSARAVGYLTARGLWRPELLRTLHIGYCSGSLTRKLPGGGKLRRQLFQMGILNERGTEFFSGRIVIPFFANGVLVGVYGRAISDSAKVPHLYLKGPHRGVFNLAGLQDGKDVILAEAPLDALSLLALGFTRVTTSYGASGFTANIRAQLLRSQTKRVYCTYDADPAGDHAADQLAHDLAGHGIEVRRVALPTDCKDPNDFLRGGGTHEQFQALLDAARPVLSVRPAASIATPQMTPAAGDAAREPGPVALTAPAGPAAEAPPPTVPATPARGVATITRGPRVYEVARLPAENPLVLRVRLKVRHGEKAFIDTLNLYSDRARAAATQRLAELFGPGTPRDLIEADLFSLVDEIEERAKHEAATATTPAASMSPVDTATAIAFLAAPDMVVRIREDLAQQGVVGEDRSKLLVYLVATSRKLARPLSLCVVSRSSGGKSFIVSKVSELIPPEEYFGYTRVSSKAFFHDDTDRLRHKLLSIEEAEGMEEAAYALRVMQSNQMLRNLSTITDPATGKHKASENVVHGPVALIVTTTQELDFETVSRAFVISVDESTEQTERIHHMQRQARTLEGLGEKLHRQAIVTKHQNAQRLLKPLAVVNPFAPRLSFPTGTLRLRREHEKYLTLIDAITFLFQYQREQGVHAADDGTQTPYAVTAPADIDLANELVVASLRQAFEEVTAPTRELLRLIRTMVTDPAALTDDALGPGGRFSRRALREYTRWSDYQIRIHLKQLEELEYVQAITGSFGREYVYTLTPDHRLALDGTGTLADEIRELGLTSSADLTKGSKAA